MSLRGRVACDVCGRSLRWCRGPDPPFHPPKRHGLLLFSAKKRGSRNTRLVSSCPHIQSFISRLRGPKSVGVGAPSWPLDSSGFAGETLGPRALTGPALTQTSARHFLVAAQLQGVPAIVMDRRIVTGRQPSLVASCLA